MRRWKPTADSMMEPDDNGTMIDFADHEDALDEVRGALAYERMHVANLREELRALKAKLEPIFRVRVGKHVCADTFEIVATKYAWSLLELAHAVHVDVRLDETLRCIVMDMRAYIEKQPQPAPAAAAARGEE